MAREYYCRVVHVHMAEERDGKADGRYGWMPDLPDALLAIGTSSIRYPEPGLAVVPFRRDLTAEEAALAAKHGAVPVSEAKPRYDDAMPSKNAALLAASKR